MRALAIIPVILFHLKCGWLPGGFVGVDVFFVISGFLITSIILKEREADKFSLLSFWARRIRRILPSLLVMLAVVLATGSVILFAGDRHLLASEVNSVLTMSANFKMLRLTGDYWGHSADSVPLLHTWSLAVEEQFYLFYPLLLLGLLRMGKVWALRVLTVAAAGSLILCVLVTTGHPAHAFYLLPARAWELLAGCIAALAMTGDCRFAGEKTSAILVWCGLTIITGSFFFIDGRTGFPGYKAIFPVAGSVLVILFSVGRVGFVERILSARITVYIGRLSYPLYLWHWPIIVFAAVYEKTHGATISSVLIVMLSIAASVVSLEVIERSAKKLRSLVVISMGGCVIVAGFAAIVARSRPTYDLTGFSPVQWDGSLYSSPVIVKRLPATLSERTAGMIVAQPEIPVEASPSDSPIIHRYGAGNPSVMMLGDSHALMWAGTVDDICREEKLSVAFHLADGTPPFLGTRAPGLFSAEEKKTFDTARIRDLKKYQPHLVIIVSRWNDHLQRADELRKLIGMVRMCSPGCDILLPSQPPMADIGDTNALQMAAWIKHQGGEIETVVRAEEESRVGGNALLSQIAGEFTNCSIIQYDELYCRAENRTRFVDGGGRLLYIDDDHLSRYGADLAKEKWKKLIRASFALRATH